MSPRECSKDIGESEMKTPYDLIDVEWGEEDLRARPVNWDVDLTDEGLSEEEISEASPIEYELCCPNCGSQCVFGMMDPQIECECGSSTSNPLYTQECEPEIEEQGIQAQEKQSAQKEQPIQEPECADDDKNDDDDDVFDSLIQSINDNEVELDQIDPDNNEQNSSEKQSKPGKEKAKKAKKKKTKKKKTKKKKSKKNKSNE